MRGLSRLEARYVILRDALYATQDESATRSRPIGHADGGVTSDKQRAAVAEVTLAFDDYRRVVAVVRDLLSRGHRAQALRLVDGEGATRAERLDTALDRVVRGTDATTQAALREATRLEHRTWMWVMTGPGRGDHSRGQRDRRLMTRRCGSSVATRAVGAVHRAHRGGGDEVGDLARPSTPWPSSSARSTR
jgi:hypothetical protein